jgi:hypothetical protein
LAKRSEVTFYHGTRTEFGRGGFLFPGDMVDKDNHALARSDVVYVTTDLGLAKAYAKASAGRGRPKVLEVVPMDTLREDDSTVGGQEQDSFTCPWAKVVRVVWRNLERSP